MRGTPVVFAILAIVGGVSCAQLAQMKANISQKLSKSSGSASAEGLDSTWAKDDSVVATTPPAKCTLPLHRDDYYGFSIGHPDGWRIDYSSGSIVVAKDKYEYVGAMVFPARLHRSDMPADKVADTFATGLAHTITARGGSFDITDKHTSGKVARANVTATIGGVDLKGPLEVVEKPGFVTVKLYWAPVEEFDDDEPTLSQIVSCFARKTSVTAKKPVAPPGGPVTQVGFAAPASSGSGAPAQALSPHQGRYYSLSMAPGFKITDELETGVDFISADGRAGGGFGFIINPIKSAQAYLRGDLNSIWPGVHIVQAGFLPAPPGWQIAAAEFDGQTRGNPIHGFMRVAVSKGAMTMASFTTAPDKWDAYRETLTAMVASVQILPAAVAKVHADVRAQLARYPPIKSSSASSDSSSSGIGMSQWLIDRQKAQDKTQLGFDDGIRGQDRALSPSTGEEYVCPNNLWNSDGPQGPGYYRELPGGGQEQLKLETTSGGGEAP